MTTAPAPLDLRLQRFSGQLNIKLEGARRMVLCQVRKRWLMLQPEEFVRQLLLRFLIGDMQYNRNRITVERGLEVNGMARRSDILVFDNHMRPFLLIECKAPQVPLDDSVFRQAAQYNGPLRVPFIMVSNGRHSYVARIDYAAETFLFQDAVPEW